MKINSEDSRILTEKFVCKFKCIADKCESHCCQGWTISVEKKVFLHLKKNYSNIAQSNHLALSLKKNKNALSNWTYGVIETGKDGVCPFLNEKKLCDIHDRFGQNRLSWVCKDFPKTIVKGLQHNELLISLGCPEAARLCILEEDAVEIIEVDHEIISNMSGAISLPTSLDIKQQAYTNYRDDIRQIFLQFINAEQYPISGRLFLMLYFSSQLNDHFNSSIVADNLDQVIQKTIEKIADPETRSILINEFYSEEYDPMPFLIIIDFLLSIRSKDNSSLKKLVEKILTENFKNYTSREIFSLTNEEKKNLFEKYYNRLKNLNQSHNKRINLFLKNYISHQIFFKNYTSSPSLIHYMRRLLIKINLILFLFVMNPKLSEFSNLIDEKKEETKTSIKAINESIVESVWTCSRALDHENRLLSEIIDKILVDYNFDLTQRLSMLTRISG